jgi:hypothetical protein
MHAANRRPDAPIPSASQHQIISRELPERQNIDRTCQMNHDRTQARVYSVHLLCTPSHATDVSIRHPLTGRRPCRPVTFTVLSPVMIQQNPSLPSTFINDRTLKRRVRSHRNQRSVSERQHLHFTNFSTLDQICQPPSVSPYAHVLAYFHKHFQGC